MRICYCRRGIATQGRENSEFFAVYISIPKDNCLAKMFSLHCGSLGATDKRFCLDFPSLFESVCFFSSLQSQATSMLVR